MISLIASDFSKAFNVYATAGILFSGKNILSFPMRVEFPAATIIAETKILFMNKSSFIIKN